MSHTHRTFLQTGLAILALGMSITAPCWGQEKSLGSYDALAHDVISKIDQMAHDEELSYIEKRNGYLRLLTKIKHFQTLAEAEREFATELSKISEEVVRQVTVELDQIQEMAAKPDGIRIQSEETIEYLVRNCLIEEQRLQFDSITTKLLRENSKPNDKEFEAARLRLKAEEISLDGMKDKLEATKKKIDEAKGGERIVNDLSLNELEKEIDVRTVQLRAKMLEFEQAQASRAASYEDQVLNHKLRQELITKQLDRLSNQQEWASKAKQLNARLEAATKRKQEAEHSLLKSVTKIRELETLKEIVSVYADVKKKEE